MLTIEERAQQVFAEAWRLLPRIKDEAWISGIALADLNAKHGTYCADDGVLTLSTRIFWGRTPEEIQHIDVNGNYPAECEPYTSRGLHVCLHEAMHAIGTATGLDTTPEWLALSGWAQSDDDLQGTGRYYERRPGWTPQGASEWRYRKGSWFCRPYSSKSCHEDFADCGTHIALGWNNDVQDANGHAKMRYMLRYVWEQTPQQMLQATGVKWRQRLGIAG